MVFDNTPPVSPREPVDDSDDEIGDNEEIVEVESYDGDDIEELYAGVDGLESGEEEEDEEDEEMNREPVQDQSVAIFDKHSGSVFCCHLEPKEGRIAVSGGEDDKAYVWDITDGKLIFECGNHCDSVTHALFSYNGVYVATADMSGFIQVWKMATKAVVWSFEIGGDLTWLEWHPASHILLAGASEGETWMWKIPSGDCRTFAGHGEPNACGKIFPDGKRLAVAFDDGSVKVFDLKTSNVIQHFNTGMGGGVAVLSIDCHRDNNLIATGLSDSTVKLNNSQSGKVLATLSCFNSSPAETSVEVVSFCPDSTLNLVVTGTLDGKISFWDIPSQIERQMYNQESGVVKIVWHPNTPHVLFSTGLDGVIRMIDSLNATLIRQFTGHMANILDISISCDGKYIVTSSDDQTCRVFTTQIEA